MRYLLRVLYEEEEAKVSVVHFTTVEFLCRRRFFLLGTRSLWFLCLVLERYDDSDDINAGIVGIWLIEVFGYKR